MQISADTLDIATNSEYFGHLVGYFLSILLLIGKKKDIDTGAYT